MTLDNTTMVSISPLQDHYERAITTIATIPNKYHYGHIYINITIIVSKIKGVEAVYPILIYYNLFLSFQA